jgi:hypothetical protein
MESRSDHSASSRLLAGVVVLLCMCTAASGLSCDFYDDSCPDLDSIVQARVYEGRDSTSTTRQCDAPEPVS